MLQQGFISRRMSAVALVAVAALAVAAAACGDDEEDSGGPTATREPAAAQTEEPQAKTPPLIVGYYNGEEVTYLLTDASTEADAAGLSDATGYPVTFVASLGDVPDASTAKLYLFMNGVEGPNPFGFQPNVVDSVPGDALYSPLWRVYAVTWADSATPVELKSEAEILAAQSAGDLTFEKAPLVKNSPVVTETPPLVGGFYDGETVDYFLTDVSTEADAAGLSDATGFPVTFVASLGDIPDTSLAKLYLFMNGVEGSNPFGFQPNVVDTVPGDPGYSPLWRVYAVTWADGVEPSELKSEQEILDAEAAGDLTLEKTPLVKNSPIVQ